MGRPSRQDILKYGRMDGEKKVWQKIVPYAKEDEETSEPFPDPEVFVSDMEGEFENVRRALDRDFRRVAKKRNLPNHVEPVLRDPDLAIRVAQRELSVTDLLEYERNVEPLPAARRISRLIGIDYIKKALFSLDTNDATFWEAVSRELVNLRNVGTLAGLRREALREGGDVESKFQNDFPNLASTILIPRQREFFRSLALAGRQSPAKQDSDPTSTVWRDRAPTIRPNSKLKARDIFDYGLILCSEVEGAEIVPENYNRLRTLLEVAERMQTSSGNFRWAWGDKRAKDPNTADFCMRGAALMVHQYEKQIKDHDRETFDTLHRIVKKSINHLWRPVPEKFTNIALMNASNLLLIGEAMKWPRVSREGLRRLERIAIYTWEWGVHEFYSSTYTAIQMNTLLTLERFARDKEAAGLSRTLADYFLAFSRLNWLDSVRRMGGTRSRKRRDYLRSDGRVDDMLWAAGWPTARPNDSMPMYLVYIALTVYGPGKETFRDTKTIIERLREAATRSLRVADVYLGEGPRLVTESWGPNVDDIRKVAVFPEIALSSSSKAYDYPDNQDLPLTVDLLPRSGHNPRAAGQPPTDPKRRFRRRAIPLSDPNLCYFLPDVERDPYGKNAKHHAPLYWGAAQSENDALCQVVYDARERGALESHFVVPHVEAGGVEITVNGYLVVAQGNFRCEFMDGNFSSLIVRFPDYGDSAVGFRVGWMKNTRFGDPRVILLRETKNIRSARGDTETISVVRLTFQHHIIPNEDHKRRRLSQSGLGFCVSVFSPRFHLDFDRWKDEFLQQKVVLSEVTTRKRGARLIETASVSLPDYYDLGLAATTNRRGRFVTRYSPSLMPKRNLVASNYRRLGGGSLARGESEHFDVGRAILEEGSFLKNRYLAFYRDHVPVVLERGAPHVAARSYLYPDEADVASPVVQAVDKGAWGRSFVWMKPQKGRRGTDVGNVRWKLNVNSLLPVYMWAKVQAGGEGGSFRFRIFGIQSRNAGGTQIQYEDAHLSKWTPPAGKRWVWIPVDLAGSGGSSPSPIQLVQGQNIIQLFAIRAGLKLGGLFVTDSIDERPNDKKFTRRDGT